MAKRRWFPDSLVLILALVLCAQVATWLVPAGEFVREGRRVVAGSYHAVEAEPLAPWAFLLLVPRGLAGAQDVIFFVFLVGGVIGVVRATGAIDALLASALERLGSRPVWLVAGMTSVLALGSSTVGMAEEYMPFVPLLVTMCIALRLDAVVAMGIVYVGAAVGYGCAALNPFTVLIAQGIAGLPPTSGQGLRWAFLAASLVVGVLGILRYARRVRAHPERSLVHDVDYGTGFAIAPHARLGGRTLGVLCVLALGVALLVWGVAAHRWGFEELGAVFLGAGLLGALVGGLSPNRAAREFGLGAAEMTSTALLIGFARTIEVVLSEGRVIDTVIQALAEPLQAAGPHLGAVGMLAVQSVCNLFVPSGSGQAYVTMPIMAPLSDLVGVTRQTAVLAYQIGDGFTNALVPTNALLMGMLALARVPYGRWLRFLLPILAQLYLVALAFLMLAVAIEY